MGTKVSDVSWAVGSKAGRTKYQRRAGQASVVAPQSDFTGRLNLDVRALDERFARRREDDLRFYRSIGVDPRILQRVADGKF